MQAHCFVPDRARSGCWYWSRASFPDAVQSRAGRLIRRRSKQVQPDRRSRVVSVDKNGCAAQIFHQSSEQFENAGCQAFPAMGKLCKKLRHIVGARSLLRNALLAIIFTSLSLVCPIARAESGILVVHVNEPHRSVTNFEQFCGGGPAFPTARSSSFA